MKLLITLLSILSFCVTSEAFSFNGNKDLADKYTWYKVTDKANNVVNKEVLTNVQVRTKEFGSVLVAMHKRADNGFDVGLYYNYQGTNKQTYIEVDEVAKDKMLKDQPVQRMYLDVDNRDFTVYISKNILYLGILKVR